MLYSINLKFLNSISRGLFVHRSNKKKKYHFANFFLSLFDFITIDIDNLNPVTSMPVALFFVLILPLMFSTLWFIVFYQKSCLKNPVEIHPYVFCPVFWVFTSHLFMGNILFFSLIELAIRYLLGFDYMYLRIKVRLVLKHVLVSYFIFDFYTALLCFIWVVIVCNVIGNGEYKKTRFFDEDSYSQLFYNTVFLLNLPYISVIVLLFIITTEIKIYNYLWAFGVLLIFLFGVACLTFIFYRVMIWWYYYKKN